MRRFTLVVAKVVLLLVVLWTPARRILFDGVSAVVMGGANSVRALWSFLAGTEAGQRLETASKEVSLVSVPIAVALVVSFLGFIILSLFPRLVQRSWDRRKNPFMYQQLNDTGYRYERRLLPRLIISRRWW